MTDTSPKSEQEPIEAGRRRLELSRRDLLARAGIAASAVAVAGPLAETAAAAPAARKATAAGSPRPGRGIAGLANAFIGFNPALSPQLASIAVIRQVFEAPMRWDATSKTYVPWLFEAAPNRTAAKTFTAKIRAGAKFHDGSPVTAADVAWTVAYYKNPKTASFYSTFLQTIAKVEGTGSTVIIHVTQELPSFHFSLTIPMVMPSKIFKQKGADAFSASPVGTGPYQFVSQTPGQRVQLKKFAGYNGTRKGKLQAIDLRYFLDDSSREVQLTAKQLDIIDGVPYRDLASLQKTGIKTGATDGGRSAIVETNQFKGPFKDQRVRQALLYALDRKKLIASVFPGGNALVADSQLPPSHPYYKQPKTVYGYDPEKAKSLLKAAGHPKGFNFDFLLSTIPWITQLGTLMKEQLDAIGMKGAIRLTETEAGYGIVATKKYDIYVAYGNWYALGSFADVAYRAFNYGAGRDGFYGKVPGRDDRYDKLVDAAFEAKSEKAQIAGYLAVQELYSKSVLNNYSFLFPRVTGAWQPYVTGYSASGDDVPSLNTAAT